jgi:hypothetical protein
MVNRPNIAPQTVVVLGNCIHKLKEKSYLMVFNIQRQAPDMIKILDTHTEATCLEYGPYDNGHILVGLEDGQLLAYEYPSLENLERTQVF